MNHAPHTIVIYDDNEITCSGIPLAEFDDRTLCEYRKDCFEMEFAYKRQPACTKEGDYKICYCGKCKPEDYPLPANHEKLWFLCQPDYVKKNLKPISPEDKRGIISSSGEGYENNLS
jgi:hypothetical protein